MRHVQGNLWGLAMTGCFSLATLAGCCHGMGNRQAQPAACPTSGEATTGACGEAIYQTSPQFFPVPTRPVFSSRVADAREDVSPYLPGVAGRPRQPGPTRLPATNPAPEEMPAPTPQPPTSLDADTAAPMPPSPIKPDGSSWLFSPRVPDTQLKTLDPSVELKSDAPAKAGAK